MPPLPFKAASCSDSHGDLLAQRCTNSEFMSAVRNIFSPCVNCTGVYLHVRAVRMASQPQSQALDSRRQPSCGESNTNRQGKVILHLLIRSQPLIMHTAANARRPVSMMDNGLCLRPSRPRCSSVRSSPSSTPVVSKTVSFPNLNAQPLPAFMHSKPFMAPGWLFLYARSLHLMLQVLSAAFVL